MATLHPQAPAVETPAESTHAGISVPESDEEWLALGNQTLQQIANLIEEVRMLREENAHLRAQADAANAGGST